MMDDCLLFKILVQWLQLWLVWSWIYCFVLIFYVCLYDPLLDHLGTGGRIRDVQATGRGAHVIAGTAGYSFGNLLIPGYKLDWECPSEVYPNNFAKPLEIAIEASNGASDYGNKFGEPVITGFARSFGMRLANGN